MANHHAVDFGRELPKDSQFLRVQLLARALDFRQLVMRIERRR